MSLVQLRRATEADCTLLSEIGAETFRDTFAEHNTPDNMAMYLAAAFNPAQQLAELAEPTSVFLIAEVDGVPTGYARVTWTQPPPCVPSARAMDLERLYIRRPWIGRGVAPMLMQACLDEAARVGSDVVWLGVWEHNHRARAFYRKWGFTEVGDHPFVLGTDPQRDLVLVRAMSHAG